MGKKIAKRASKTVKRATKQVSKQVVRSTKDVAARVAGVIGLAKAPKMSDVELPDAVPAAAQVDVAGEGAASEKDGDSERRRKKAQSAGKGKLTVARISGRGLNL